MMQNLVEHWMGGAWRSDGEPAPLIDPASGNETGIYAQGTAALAEEAIGYARQSFEGAGWAAKPRLRSAVLLAYADELEKRKEALIDRIVLESGKLRGEATHEVIAAISESRYYAGLARTIFGRVQEIDEGWTSVYAREAIGVAAIIVPWNAPATLLVRSLAPALAAGCTAVVKPANQTSGVNRLMMEALAAVDALPAGVVNSVNESGSDVGRALVASADVDVISFTGASATGRQIMADAAGTLKRLSLELGGKAPSLIFADAEMDEALTTVTRCSLVMAGQMCTAITRILVEDGAYDQVASELSNRMASVQVGPGNDPASQMGPLIDVANRERLLGVIDGASRAGEVLVKGEAFAPQGYENGAFITPTLVAVDDPETDLVQQELFGPIITLERFGSEEEAVSKSNATPYGLAASVWTRDLKRAQRVARAIRAGTVWLNSHNRLFAEAETGGFKQSGQGRLHGLEGLNDFLETKHIFSESGWISG